MSRKVDSRRCWRDGAGDGGEGGGGRFFPLLVPCPKAAWLCGTGELRCWAHTQNGGDGIQLIRPLSQGGLSSELCLLHPPLSLAAMHTYTCRRSLLDSSLLSHFVAAFLRWIWRLHTLVNKVDKTSLQKRVYVSDPDPQLTFFKT
jgi:hypothetical protein